MRQKLLFLFLLFFALAIIARLFYWQVLEREKLSALGEAQYWQTLEIFGRRGQIFTSDNSSLVLNQPSYLVFASLPDLKEKPHDVALKLAPILWEEEGEDSLIATHSAQKDKILAIKKLTSEIEKRLSLPNLVWVPIKHKVSKETMEKIRSLNITGLGFEPEEKRFYPEASMAAQLLGFVGQDSAGRETGYFGLEGYYNHELKGRAGLIRQEKDAQGRPILVGRQKSQDAEDGRSLILSLDKRVQFIVEEKLKKASEIYGAKGGTVIVMEPKTGKVLAMASSPAYDPMKFLEHEPQTYKNPAVSDTYEPGSVFKLITFAAALNENLVKPETVCDQCTGPLPVADYLIKTWNEKYYPNTTVKEILEHSDNVGAVFIAKKLGIEKFVNYVLNFGFGALSGIDLQEETLGNIRPKNEWKGIDLAVGSFGQGLAITPIQMVRAVAAIANGGELIVPQVVTKIVGKDKQIEIKPKVVRRVIKPQTAKALTELMISAVEKGEARWAKPKGYKIAGKTGTAQIPIAGHYDPKKTIASFVGFAPVDNPRFVMLTLLSEPTSSSWGSETAAPLFFDIARELFYYWGIAPGN